MKSRIVELFGNKKFLWIFLIIVIAAVLSITAVVVVKMNSKRKGELTGISTTDNVSIQTSEYDTLTSTVASTGSSAESAAVSVSDKTKTDETVKKKPDTASSGQKKDGTSTTAKAPAPAESAVAAKVGDNEEGDSIGGNKITGRIGDMYTDGRPSDMIDSYDYKAPVTGKYLVLFDVNNVYGIRMTISDSKGNVVAGCDSRSGGTEVNMVSGMTYKITIDTYRLSSDYSIEFNIPNPPETVKLNGTMKGDFRYAGQENVYYFSPDETGDYVIITGIDRALGPLTLIVSDSKGNEIERTSGYPQNALVNLKQGDEYTIKFCADTQYAAYNGTIVKYEDCSNLDFILTGAAMA